MNFNWTRYVWDNRDAVYTNSTYFKQLFTEEASEYNNRFDYTSNDLGFVTRVKVSYSNYDAFGWSNSEVAGTFTTIASGFSYIAPYLFAEEKIGDNYLFVWKDENNPSYYLINFTYKTASNIDGALIIGNNISNNYVGKIVIKNKASVDYSLLTDYISANSLDAQNTNYAIQPIIANGEITPLYFVMGYSSLAIFSEFEANNKRFKIIANGIAIEIPKED